MNTCGPYIVKQTIGKGAFATVKLVEHSETGKEYALKMMPRNDEASAKNAFEKEVTIMQELDHSGIIKMLDFSDSAVYTLSNGKQMNVYYIVLELAKCGELFDMISITGSYSELIARYHFRQLIAGIEHMHSKGIVHRDIKPENILLDEKLNFKLTDFGFSTFEETSSHKQGTPSYMAPEIFYSSNFLIKPTDIFSLGIVLFIMIKGAPPFEYATPNNPHYQVFCSKQSYFWRMHTKKIKTLFSTELKELISLMLDYDPERRITIDFIKESAWYNGPLPTEEQLEEDRVERMHKLEQLQSD